MIRVVALFGVVVATLVAAGCSGNRPSSVSEPEPAGFAEALREIEMRSGGRIGVYALDTGSGAELAHRADDRFAMASTFKALLAAAVLARVDAGRLDLNDPVDLTGATLQPHSPVVKELQPAGTASIGRLCEAAVTVSDNTATNLLLDLVDGPEGFTDYLRSIGDDTTRLDRYEVELNSNLPGDPRDTTTPRAMAESLRTVLFGDTLSAESAERLRDWLIASKTGFKRIRARLPDGWQAGDKTGSGMNGAANDCAVFWPPGRDPILLTIYMSDSEKDFAALNPFHAEIAAWVVENFVESPADETR